MQEALITECLWSTYCVRLAPYSVEGRACPPGDLLHLARLFFLKPSGRESSQVWKGCHRRFRLTEHACPGLMPQTPRPLVDATSCPAQGASLGASVSPIPGRSLEHVCGAGWRPPCYESVILSLGPTSFLPEFFNFALSTLMAV